MPTTTRMATTPCTTHAQIFHADALTPATATTSQAVENLAETVDDTIEAITACSFCPLVQACKNRTVEQIQNGDGPTGVVQAGVYWGSDSRPDFTLNGCVSAQAAHQAAVESGLESTITEPTKSSTISAVLDGPIDTSLGKWDIAWVPEPQPRINWPAVHMAIHPASSDLVVTESYVRRHPEQCFDDKELLTDADVDEVIRLLWKKDQSIRYISVVLRQSWKTVERRALSLGIEVNRSPERAAARRRYEQQRAEERRQAMRQPVHLDELHAGETDNTDGQLFLTVTDDMVLTF